jgi:DNA-binding transcriptional ArsR family regulator
MRQTDLSQIKKATYLLKCMAHPLRLALLCALSEVAEMNVGQLVQAQHHASQSQVSQYLGRLRKQGLVATRRKRQTIYYRLTSREVKSVLKLLHSLYCKKAPS